MFCGEIGQSAHQPVVGERRANADAQAIGCGDREALRAQIAKILEYISNSIEHQFARRRRRDAAIATNQQRNAHEALDPAQAMAHRALRDAELKRRACHPAEAGSGLKGDQGIEGRQAGHISIMNEIHGDVKRWRWPVGRIARDSARSSKHTENTKYERR